MCSDEGQIKHLCFLFKRDIFALLNVVIFSFLKSLCPSGNGLMKPKWGPNLKEFKRRFDPGTTSGEGETECWVLS